MESKASIHSSHSARLEERVIQETLSYDEKKAGSFYDNEDAIGGNTQEEYHDEDSPIEEVKAVVPK